MVNFSLSVLDKTVEAKNDNTMLSPIQSQPVSNELSIVFDHENERIDFANLTVDVNQENKQIVVDVSMSMSLTQNPNENGNQSLNVSSTNGVIIEDTFVKTPDNTRVTRNSINTTKSSTEINYKSTDAVSNDSVKMNTTPAMEYLSFQQERTPIGVIRLRKITPKIETPEIYISDDDDEEYEIVVVNKSQHSHMFVEHIDLVDSTMNDSEEDQPAADYPMMPINSAIASKSTAKAHPFPFSPRIILHRINSIDECQQSVPIQETPKVVTVNENRRKPRQMKVARTKKGTYVCLLFVEFFVLKQSGNSV